MVDWLKLLSNHRIEYVTRGRNVGRGYIAVHCPWCGSADPSQHLNINLRGKGWRCWRNQAHGGISATYLVAALLNCSPEQAAVLVGEDIEVTLTDEDFAGSLAKLLSIEEETKSQLALPVEAKPLDTSAASADVFWEYLQGRGYGWKGIKWLSKQYDLYYAYMGKLRYRLIIPIKDEKGNLVSFTARTILKKEQVRYRSPAGVGPGQSLLGMPWLKNTRGKLLIICEGPFDAFRVTYLGHTSGIYATCLFGLHISTAQIDLLTRLANQFSLGLGLCLDADANFPRMSIMERCAHLPIVPLDLPEGLKDAAEFDANIFAEALQHWLPRVGDRQWTQETQSLMKLF